ncbi:MAG: hypothetical protein MAG795_00133 [Candidatus Woesearchaeota archaeon]|nr:hypothetical protein [Candidatus Woesearchaeota archaeon]
MKSEQLFFKYSFPCAQVLLDQKKIDKKTYQKLKKLFEQNKTPDKEFLEKTFKSAFRRLKSIAKKQNKSYWDKQVIQNYFLLQHNKFIDNGDGDYAKAPESFKKICKVYKVKVLDIEDNILTVNSKITPKVLHNLDKVQIKDTVTIHLGFAVQVI